MRSFTKNYFTKKDLEELSKEYKYLVTAKDNMLSYWGDSERKAHYQMILCKNDIERNLIMNDCKNDNMMSYVNWYPLTKSFYTNILSKQRHYNITLRNDWTRIYN